MWCVYVIKSRIKKYYYKGLTDNLERRLDQHNKGKEKTTKPWLPYDLIFVEICKTRKEARLLEKYLKSGSGRELIEEFES